MKKFYEAPVVEMTGFSAEDVITTSAVVGPIEPTTKDAAAYYTDFEAAVATKYGTENVSTYKW